MVDSLVSEGRGCLEEECLGLPGVFPDIFELQLSIGKCREKTARIELPDLACQSQTPFSQTSATTRLFCSIFLGFPVLGAFCLGETDHGACKFGAKSVIFSDAYRD